MFSKAYKAFSAGRKLAYLAVFIALSVAVNSFELNLVVAKVTFTYLVCFTAAVLLGGVPAFAVGFLGDAIGFLINPSGVYWLFGLTLGLFGFLSGILVHTIRIPGKHGVYARAVIALAVCFLVISCGVNLLVNYSYMVIFLADTRTFIVYVAARIPVVSVVYLVNAAVSLLVLPVFLNMRAFRPLILRKEDSAVSAGEPLPVRGK